MQYNAGYGITVGRAIAFVRQNVLKMILDAFCRNKCWAHSGVSEVPSESHPSRLSMVLGGINKKGEVAEHDTCLRQS